MAATREKTIGSIAPDAPEGTGPEPHVNKIDRTAPAGSENSLGEESVRDGRPSTDDSVVEAKDEEGPDVTAPMETDEGGS